MRTHPLQPDPIFFPVAPKLSVRPKFVFKRWDRHGGPRVFSGRHGMRLSEMRERATGYEPLIETTCHEPLRETTGYEPLKATTGYEPFDRKVGGDQVLEDAEVCAAAP